METVKQGNATTADAIISSGNDSKKETLFTQEDLDRVVKERLAREREKYGDYSVLKEKAAKLDKIEEESKSELQKASEKATALQNELDNLKKAEAIRQIRNKVAQDTGVPANLLTENDEESCMEQAQGILEFSRPNGYPKVPDGGEVRTDSKRSTRESFAEWFNENI